MYKILIAEDEPAQSEMLEQMILCFLPNAHIVHANNGGIALQKARSEDFDMLFTDIKMPESDGLFLLENIEKINPRTVVVVVSGYRVFEYCQSAVRHGAIEYLTKPVTESMLYETLEKALDHLRSIPIESPRSIHLGEWIQGEKGNDDITGLFSQEQMGVILLAKRLSNTKTDQLLKSDISMLTLSGTMPFSFSIHEENLFHGYIFLFSNSFDRSDFIFSLKKLAQKYMDTTESHTFFSMSSTFKLCTEDRIIGLEQAFLAARYAFYDQFFPVSLFDEITENHRLTTPDLYRHFEKNFDYRLDCVALKKYLENFKELVTSGGNSFVPPSIVRDACEHILFESLKRISAFFDALAYSNIVRNSKRSLETAQTLDALISITLDIISLSYEKVKKLQNKNTKTIIECCLKYLDENYFRDISMEMVASMFFYNTSYFSMLFKKHAGVPFQQYLIKLRMLHAENMLRTTDKKVFEVAQAVGYSNARQFMTMFKKLFGMTPDEYRKFSALKR